MALEQWQNDISAPESLQSFLSREMDCCSVRIDRVWRRGKARLTLAQQREDG